jgi:phosphoribosylformimino-5-aminoimidazole carboxamide ribotide isomerase
VKAIIPSAGFLIIQPRSAFSGRLHVAGVCVILHVLPLRPVSNRSSQRVDIWPAIDLRGGKCVRLRQGDYQQETVFGEDPAAMARHWVDLGAKCLHLVDLDGARDGRPANLAGVRAIVEAVDVPCELGGGIRDEACIRELLNLGLKRLVIGTLALREPDWFREMCRKYPGKLVLGIDSRAGRVAIEGWLTTSSVWARDLPKQFAGEPIAALIYTDIFADGMLWGTNVKAMAEMKDFVEWPVIASGGITTIEEIQQLASVPMDGCIIGRALYEGTITLPEALKAIEHII